ncbi:MAG: hypothetical protein ACK56I_14930, partial [bacterium]
ACMQAQGIEAEIARSAHAGFSVGRCAMLMHGQRSSPLPYQERVSLDPRLSRPGRGRPRSARVRVVSKRRRADGVALSRTRKTWTQGSPQREHFRAHGAPVLRWSDGHRAREHA